MAEMDYEEWVENVAQSVAILLNCMRAEDRERILERVHTINQEHDAARATRQPPPPAGPRDLPLTLNQPYPSTGP